MITGTIFNIQRFSIHDGPGIRSTVFFKGCSLFCFWCHNPEGRRPRPEIQYFPDRCIADGACLEVCRNGAHEMQNGVHVYYRDRCLACGRCAEGCFAGAVQLTGKMVSVDEVVAEVARDRAFYESSQGGITLSGGEPLLQPAFALAILQRCQAEGIHTAIETAGNCRWQDLEALLPFTDLILMDLKHMDPIKHRQATGVDNARILDNARRLMATDRPVRFRVPVVPTVNDTDCEIGAIAGFVRRLSELRDDHNRLSGRQAEPPSLELLPFHKLAADKFRSLGLEDRAGSLTPLSKEQMNELRETAKHPRGLADLGGAPIV